MAEFKVGFDIGGTNARIMFFDREHRPCWEERQRVRERQEPELLVDVLTEMVARGLGELEAQPEQCIGVGVGVAGQLDRAGQVVLNGPNLGWRNVALGSLLQEAVREKLSLEVPVRLVNDLNAQVVGELRAGAARGAREVLATYVGSGVGGAIISDGRLVHGASGNAGEIGHSKVVVEGRRCGCGQRGCVEAYAGGVHLETRVAELVKKRKDDKELAPLLTDNRVDLQGADRLAANHRELELIWEEATNYLAMVIANGITLTNPELLLLGGGVLENCTYFRAQLMQKILPLVLAVARRDLEVGIASISDYSGMLGAAELAI